MHRSRLEGTCQLRVAEPGYFFNGLIDEVSIYNRALTASEIQAIYAADSGGKCPLSAPVITSQPTNQTVTVGGTSTFSITASGAAPLSYQWNFNGTNLSGATNTSLTLTNVQWNQAGNYAVLVTNLYGSILSSNAVLTVTLDHFAWGSIPSLRFANAPFAVTILAQDMTNGPFTNFTGTAILGTTNGIAVAPSVSGNFVQGVLDRLGGDFPDGFEPRVTSQRWPWAFRPRQSHQCHQPAQRGHDTVRKCHVDAMAGGLFGIPVGNVAKPCASRMGDSSLCPSQLVTSC